MKNYVQSDETATRTAPIGGVVSGRGVQIGQLLLISTVTADAGARFVGQVTGEITHAKHAGEAWAEGAVLFWDESAHEFTTTSAGNLQAGTAAAAAASDATTGSVRLDGIGRAHDGT